MVWQSICLSRTQAERRREQLVRTAARPVIVHDIDYENLLGMVIGGDQFDGGADLRAGPGDHAAIGRKPLDGNAFLLQKTERTLYGRHSNQPPAIQVQK